MFRELVLKRLESGYELRRALHDRFCEALIVCGISFAEFREREEYGEDVVRGMLQFTELIEEGGRILWRDCLLTVGGGHEIWESKRSRLAGIIRPLRVNIA